MFLCRLCNMPDTVLSYHVFNAKLAQYVCSIEKRQKGFIPDVIKILQKYTLSHHLVDYLQSGIFPSHHIWKPLCKHSIRNYEHNKWTARINADDTFRRFKFLQTNIERSILWECANNTTSLYNAYKISKLWINKHFSQPETFLCELCGVLTDDAFKHRTLECSETEINRDQF